MFNGWSSLRIMKVYSDDCRLWRKEDHEKSNLINEVSSHYKTLKSNLRFNTNENSIWIVGVWWSERDYEVCTWSESESLIFLKNLWRYYILWLLIVNAYEEGTYDTLCVFITLSSPMILIGSEFLICYHVGSILFKNILME